MRREAPSVAVKVLFIEKSGPPAGQFQSKYPFSGTYEIIHRRLIFFFTIMLSVKNSCRERAAPCRERGRRLLLHAAVDSGNCRERIIWETDHAFSRPQVFCFIRNRLRHHGPVASDPFFSRLHFFRDTQRPLWRRLFTCMNSEA